MSDTVKNPLTGKDIKIGGSVFKRLTKEQFEYDEETGTLVPKDGCEVEEQEKIINPETGKSISVGGTIYKNLIADGYENVDGELVRTGKPTRVKNPTTGRPIKIDSPQFKKLQEQGYVYDEETNSFNVPETERLYVINPESGKKVLVGGSTFKTLSKKYRYDEEANEFFDKEEEDDDE